MTGLVDAELAAMVAEVLDIDPAEVVDEAGPATVSNWTSLRHLQLVVAIEETYGISLTAEDIRTIRSVGDIRVIVARRGSAAPRAGGVHRP